MANLDMLRVADPATTRQRPQMRPGMSDDMMAGGRRPMRGYQPPTSSRPAAGGERMMPMPSDVKAVASWIRRALDGACAIPAPLVNQLAACLYATGYCDDFNQAKALAVIAAAGRRVA